MSKLAHSHQPTMDEIDRKRAIETGNEDLLPECLQCGCNTTKPNYTCVNVDGPYCDDCIDTVQTEEYQDNGTCGVGA